MNKTTGIFLCCLLAPYVSAEPEPPVLPDPLDLGYALNLATDEKYSDIIAARSRQELALSELNQADSNLALQIDLEFEAAYIKPSALAFNQNKDDHSATLKISKPLYDFGQTDNKQAAAEAELRATKNTMKYVYDLRRIEIAGRFFAVILADLKYAWHTEAMATAYVQSDAVKDRHALGEVSDVVLLKADDKYQLSFQQRSLSESQQRITRSMLAEVMNMPGVLSSRLKTPHLEYHKKTLPEYDSLVDIMMQKNTQISLQKTRVEAAYKRLQAARFQTRPRLSAELEVAEYSRDSIAKENWRASLNLSLPLLEHAGVKAEVSRQRSDWLKQRAMLLSTQSQLRQRLYELWQNIQLLKMERKQLIHSMDYRELRLDRNRALYELEVKTDLGDAMVAISEMRYKQAITDFKLVLQWMELLMLLNEDVIKGDLTMNGALN